jgi:hypothetical protein
MNSARQWSIPGKEVSSIKFESRRCLSNRSEDPDPSGLEYNVNPESSVISLGSNVFIHLNREANEKRQISKWRMTK